MRIVLLASGSGSLAQAIIDAAARGTLDIDILALISDRDSLALSRATNAGIVAKHLPINGDRDSWNAELFSYVSNLNPDLVVSVGFMRILAPKFVEKFPTINTHPALLPNFPGAHAVRDALAAGATRTGSTIHWVDEGVDTGEVIVQKEVLIREDDDEASLHESIKIVERALIVEALQKLSANGISRRI